MELALFGGAALQDEKQEMKMIGRLNHVAIAVRRNMKQLWVQKLARHKMSLITV